MSLPSASISSDLPPSTSSVPSNLTTEMSPELTILERLALVHNAITTQLEKLHSKIVQLSALAPDAQLDDINRRAHAFADSTLAHCQVRNLFLVPSIRKAQKLSKSFRKTSDDTEKPAKRLRTSFSAERETFWSNIDQQHKQLQDDFEILCNQLRTLRTTPIEQKENSRDARVTVLSNVWKTSHQVVLKVKDYLHITENKLIPLGGDILSQNDQKHIFVNSIYNYALEIQRFTDIFRVLREDYIASLLETLTNCTSPDKIHMIATSVANALTTEKWNIICARIPNLKGLVTLKHNPLIEIFCLHKALRGELNGVVQYCKHIDILDTKQLKFVDARMKFLNKVHSCHSRGEDSVLLKELELKLASSPCSLEATRFLDDHDDGDELFETLQKHLSVIYKGVRSNTSYDSDQLLKIRQGLQEAVKNVADHLIDHMQGEESQMFPLVRQHFSLSDQGRMIRKVMSKMPSEFVHELIPWMCGYLNVDEQEKLFRNMLQTAPQQEIDVVITAMGLSVQRGMTDRNEWNEICLRLPEVESKYRLAADVDQTPQIGPVSEILRIHNAIRIELHRLLRSANEIPDDGLSPDPKVLSYLADSVTFLRRMVEDHSLAEDTILLPRLESRVPGISAKYKDDHCDERKLFRSLQTTLSELQCTGDGNTFATLVRKLRHVTRTLRDEMISHLNLEEKHMWPHLTNLFTPEEQSEIVALIFGQIPESRLREMLPWMIRLMSVAEGNTMMNNIFEVTKSTMFETWLRTWLPIGGASPNESEPVGGQARDASGDSTSQVGCASEVSTGKLISIPDIRLLRCRENMERTMRSIARDESLSARDRTLMMQQVMLAPYNAVCAKDDKQQAKTSVEDDRAPTYHKNTNRLGCKHSLRACKLRASCCGKLYTCRLCHNEAENHTMDRAATKEILCMRCNTLQPVSRSCSNEKCKQAFARYFCKICVVYDDKEGKDIYHCPSCNICRVGKGLGIDFFHCMKCNQCMNMKFQRSHNCVEKAMESNCPVCSQFMFFSTEPMKHLKCGHVMHTNCFIQYQKRNYRCPICSKSLEEVTPLYRRLDQHLALPANQMPWEYRMVRCDLYCYDCEKKSNTSYHFMYNKCPICSSYNTRVERTDAAGSEREGN